jgi:hypothetical protein
MARGELREGMNLPSVRQPAWKRHKLGAHPL